MSDIVERLKMTAPREVCEHGSQKVKCPICELAEAEAEIERLRKECDDHITRARTFADGLAVTQMQVERLRAALREIDENFNVLQPLTQGSVLHRIMDIARRALDAKD